jgi:signal transduction histidine kinase
MILGKDDQSNWIELIGHLEPGVDGGSGRMLGTVRDVTRIKKSEAALRTGEKLGAVGKLAASIAHEINNPLASVTNLLYLARNSEDLDQIHAFLDMAELELRRVSAISNQTLQFYRQSTSPAAVRDRELFAGVLAIYQGRLQNSRITVEKRMRATRAVSCFEGEIRQVLSNLVGNAVDAMQTETKRLLVRSRNGTDWKTGRKGVVFTVADTGAGISPRALRKVFEPFYTTKGIGGTGLGLWVSEDIVKRHDGVLRVRSRQSDVDGGTVFTMFLPFTGPAD